MKIFRVLFPLAAVCAWSLGCASSKSSTSPAAAPPAGPHAAATIEARSGSTLTGTAMFAPTAGGGVHIVVDVNNAPEGIHAVHLHEKGDCSAPDATSAGGHFNPGHMPHGSPDAPNHHAGDFGNMTVGSDGHGHLELDSTVLTIAPGEMSVAGHAVVIHAKADDFQTQPTGNAGGRIGCGEVK